MLCTRNKLIIHYFHFGLSPISVHVHGRNGLCRALSIKYIHFLYKNYNVSTGCIFSLKLHLGCLEITHSLFAQDYINLSLAITVRMSSSYFDDVTMKENLTLCMQGNFAWLFVFCEISKWTFSEKSLRNTIRLSNSLDPDHAQHFVWLDLGLNYLQRLSADGTQAGKELILWQVSVSNEHKNT